MAERMIFVDEFFESEQNKFQEELKRIDKMTQKQKDSYYRKLTKESERLDEHFKRLAGDEEFEEYQKEMKRFFEYHPLEEDEELELMKRLMCEMKFVRNADIKKFGTLWDIENITDDVVVYTYDDPDLKQRKYAYIKEHNSVLTNPWTQREINKKRKRYEKQLGHWEYTDEDFKADEKAGREKLRASESNETGIVENVLMFALENGAVEDEVSADAGDKILDVYRKLSPVEQQIIIADIDINVNRAAKLREEENISYADYRKIKNEISRKIRSAII